MKTSFSLLVVALTLLALAPAAAFYKGWESGPWEKVDDDDGMVVYVNESAHPDVPAVRVDTTIDAPPSKVFDVVIRHDRAKNQDDVTAYKILSEDSGGFMTYQRIDPPAIDPRDFVLKGTYIRPKSEGGSYAFRWASAKGGPKPTDEAVRVSTVEGVFALEPASNGTRTRVSYRSLFNPKVGAPGFLVKRALISDATDRVETLKADVSK